MAKGKFWSDFKDFAMKGNVIDMAVGVVIGGAFGKIVSSLVDDIIMPLIGSLIGGFDFTTLKATIKDVDINYGNFIQTAVDFLIVAFCIFLIIRAITRSKRKRAAEEAAAAAAKAAEPAPKPADIALLEEIRDLLKEK